MPGASMPWPTCAAAASTAKQWHKAGNLTRKQNVFDDFVAGGGAPDQAALHQSLEAGGRGRQQWRVAHGRLSHPTSRPGPRRVSHVGIYDMLRVELDPNGQFNVTEFGTVKDPEQFRALYAYSPYHRVREGVKYPAVFLTTGENDGRVNPAQSRKMAARLQAATASGRPILLRSTASAGHGIGTSLKERIAEQADVYAFLFDQLGISYHRRRFSLGNVRGSASAERAPHSPARPTTSRSGRTRDCNGCAPRAFRREGPRQSRRQE